MINQTGIGILLWVSCYQRQHGRGPSLGRIGAGTRRASGHNRRIVLPLIADGYLARSPGRGGAVELTEKGRAAMWERAA